MPVLCPHCHRMVAERPKCTNCGGRMKISATEGQASEPLDRAMMLYLMRYVLMWMLGIVGLGVLCLLGIFLLF